MRRLLPFILILALFVVEAWAWQQFRSGSTATEQQRYALWTHVIVAAGVAILASLTIGNANLSTRVTLVVLFFIVGVVLPLAGILVVLALGWILSTPAGTGLRPEDSYVFGNPMAIAARRESRQAQPELSPLTEAMRSFSALELEKMIHGLRHLRPSRLTLHFLRRFQTDPASNLQFASQGVITGNLEQLESQLKTVTARIEASPRNIDARLAAAEILLELAAWTPEGDATAQVYLDDVLLHLQEVLSQEPQSQRALQLQVQALLGLDQSAAVAEPLAKLTNAAYQDDALLAAMQADLRAGEYRNLASLAARVEHPNAEVEETLGFWTGSIEPPAALRPKK
jgi:hypothetical protein